MKNVSGFVRMYYGRNFGFQDNGNWSLQVIGSKYARSKHEFPREVLEIKNREIVDCEVFYEFPNDSVGDFCIIYKGESNCSYSLSLRSIDSSKIEYCVYFKMSDAKRLVEKLNRLEIDVEELYVCSFDTCDLEI